ncbi:hypothetical protein DevBK_15070 [Devosia sp. BK]|uniref:hypothetical protein n=1 Tax=Devosia sp. BK TaxID=2871706 RepID=UPI00293AE3A8|nr:hypothetical protein [Devosia sp. BK]MDV3252659.1 hypothetical protein [Devosia sp. BK]
MCRLGGIAAPPDQLPCVVAGIYSKAKGWTTADSAPTDPIYGPSGGIYMPLWNAPEKVFYSL